MFKKIKFLHNGLDLQMIIKPAMLENIFIFLKQNNIRFNILDDYLYIKKSISQINLWNYIKLLLQLSDKDLLFFEDLIYHKKNESEEYWNYSNENNDSDSDY